MTADTLTLTGTGSTTLLTYSAGLAGLEGTSWTATGINNGAGGVENTALTEHVTASFGPDGAFRGFGGCNDLSGTYATTGANEIRLTGLTGTRTSCTADVDTLENAYVAALGRTTKYEISGDTLTLRDADGAIQATYRLAG
jgi:heat shock protein HslJ